MPKRGSETFGKISPTEESKHPAPQNFPLEIEPNSAANQVQPTGKEVLDNQVPTEISPWELSPGEMGSPPHDFTNLQGSKFEMTPDAIAWGGAHWFRLKRGSQHPFLSGSEEEVPGQQTPVEITANQTQIPDGQGEMLEYLPGPIRALSSMSPKAHHHLESSPRCLLDFD